jgi:hypothetical protein
MHDYSRNDHSKALRGLVLVGEALPEPPMLILPSSTPIYKGVI